MNVKYIIIALFSLLQLSCSNDDSVAPDGIYPDEQEGPIILRELSLSKNSTLKSTNSSAFSLSQSVTTQSADIEQVEHNYQTTGYIVKIFRAWVSDPIDPNGGYYSDLEFTDIDLNNQDITFETSGTFSIEVKHPDYKQRQTSYAAYYNFSRERFDNWPEGEALIINMILVQHAVFLAYRTAQAELDTEELKIDKKIVIEYQSVYVQPDKRFEIEVKYHLGRPETKRFNAGESGTCSYYWVEPKN